jgi:catechol 2,3-dioxygenase-like lactoylglutathione lyase family enzyme
VALTHIALACVPVRDTDDAVTFYRDVLGFEVVSDEVLEEGHRWVQLRPAGSVTTIALVTWFPSMPAGSVRGLVLASDDIDADAEVLRTRGLDLPTEIESAPWGRWVSFADPDGNGWVLQAPGAAEPTSEERARRRARPV